MPTDGPDSDPKGQTPIRAAVKAHAHFSDVWTRAVALLAALGSAIAGTVVFARNPQWESLVPYLIAIVVFGLMYKDDRKARRRIGSRNGELRTGFSMTCWGMIWGRSPTRAREPLPPVPVEAGDPGRLYPYEGGAFVSPLALAEDPSETGPQENADALALRHPAVGQLSLRPSASRGVPLDG